MRFKFWLDLLDIGKWLEMVSDVMCLLLYSLCLQNTVQHRCAPMPLPEVGDGKSLSNLTSQSEEALNTLALKCIWAEDPLSAPRERGGLGLSSLSLKEGIISRVNSFLDL